jgi:hypothetical protein
MLLKCNLCINTSQSPNEGTQIDQLCSRLSLCRSWYSVVILTITKCSTGKLLAHIVHRIRPAIIAGNARGWCPRLEENIISIGSHHTSIPICTWVVIIAWPIRCQRARAVGKVTILGENTDIIHRAGVLIIAWVAACGCPLAPYSEEHPINGRLCCTGVIASACIIIIACSVSSEAPPAE